MPRDRRVTIQKMTRQETADVIPGTPGELTSKEGLTGSVWINLYWPTEAAELRLWGSWQSSRGGCSRSPPPRKPLLSPTLCLAPQAAVVGDPRSSSWASLSGHLWSLMTKPAQSEKTESDQSRVEGDASRQWASPGVIPRAAIPAELFQGRPECLSRNSPQEEPPRLRGTEDV